MKKQNKISAPIKKVLQAALTMCAVLGWWGVLYPELTLTPDTYRVFYGDGTVQMPEEVVEWDFDSDIYLEILNAEPEQIRFRSKLLQTAEEYLNSISFWE